MVDNNFSNEDQSQNNMLLDSQSENKKINSKYYVSVYLCYIRAITINFDHGL